MTKSEVLKQIDNLKKRIAVAEKNNLPAMIKLNEGKIEKLQTELAKITAKEDMAKENKPTKTKLKKSIDDDKKKETQKPKNVIETKVGDRVIKMRDNLWVWEDKKTKKPLYDIQEKESGKWKVTCKGEIEKEFDSVEEAVDYISNEIYTDKLGEIYDARKKAAETRQKHAKKRVESGKTPYRDAAEQSVDEIKDVAKEIKEDTKQGKPADKSDFKQLITGLKTVIVAFKQNVSKLKTELTTSQKDEIKSLIKELNELLQQKFEKGGAVGSESNKNG